MKVLVVGNGGREHALAWKLLRSSRVKRVICTPGNGGTATLKNCENVPLAVEDFEGIAKIALENQIDLVVVGPEVPLALGITDYLQQHNLKVFGPNKAGAEIEGSKAWAKDLMVFAGIPTAKSATFTDIQAAKAYLDQEGAPIVVKADSLAAGKGVIVAETVSEAKDGLEKLAAQGFDKFVIEEYLQGQEVSVLALTDGVTIRPLLPCQDHKRIGEGDTGENTGGMGVYAPTPIATPALMERVQKEVLEPTLKALQTKGIDYRGIIYAGLMVTPEGEPKVLEFNCRFGDPETQAILPLLKTPLEELLSACVEQRLGDLPPIEWENGSSVCVIAAAGGYPGDYAKGDVITGITEAESKDAVIFHAGTKLADGNVVTAGGRVLGVTCIGKDFDGAIASAYNAISSIQFEGIYYRRDIGHRVRS